MDMNFCRRCGETLVSTQANEFSCKNQHTIFANSTPSTGIFFLQNDGKVVLARRAFEPRKGMLDTIGGFIEPEETAEQAIQREIKEETGLTPEQYSTPTLLCTAIGHYPYGGETYPVLTTFFWSHLQPGVRIIANDDVAEVITQDINMIDLNELHDIDVRKGILELSTMLRKGLPV